MCQNIVKLFPVLCLVLLSGCVPRVRNRIKFFPDLVLHEPHEVQSSSGSCQARVVSDVLSPSRAKQYFGYNPYRYGIVPIRLFIDNTGSNTYDFKPSYCSLPLLSSKNVSEHMQYSTYNWVAWTTIPAAFLCWQAIPLAIMPMGYGMTVHNKKVGKAIRKKTFQKKDSLTVYPYEKVSKFLFVPKRVYDATAKRFSIALYERESRELVRFVFE